MFRVYRPPKFFVIESYDRNTKEDVLLFFDVKKKEHIKRVVLTGLKISNLDIGIHSSDRFIICKSGYSTIVIYDVDLEIELHIPMNIFFDKGQYNNGLTFYLIDDYLLVNIAFQGTYYPECDRFLKLYKITDSKEILSYMATISYRNIIRSLYIKNNKIYLYMEGSILLIYDLTGRLIDEIQRVAAVFLDKNSYLTVRYDGSISKCSIFDIDSKILLFSYEHDMRNLSVVLNGIIIGEGQIENFYPDSQYELLDRWKTVAFSDDTFNLYLDTHGISLLSDTSEHVYKHQLPHNHYCITDHINVFHRNNLIPVDKVIHLLPTIHVLTKKF